MAQKKKARPLYACVQARLASLIEEGRSYKGKSDTVHQFAACRERFIGVVSVLDNAEILGHHDGLVEMINRGKEDFLLGGTCGVDSIMAHIKAQRKLQPRHRIPKRRKR